MADQAELHLPGTRDERIRVLFVCMGNICRSPLAEAVFRHLVRERGLEDRFVIDSAGTSGYHRGAAPDRRSTETAKRRGIELTGSSRQLVAADLRRFDYVIAMDAENMQGIQLLRERSPGTATVGRLRDWDPDPGHGDVPDPYYGGARGFDDVHDIVERATAGLLDHIVREHGLTP
ncbi:low molecular weight protein-tyrosine-phosphatase [Longimicrobium sp.]|jgi:protein-tyrosine phosphatase|uniref:low molecular weight protein-tyrosine-phosphatase n=1 Tax=Longimicrobium sp. TaxID=2029185 RepID=UPI002F94C7B5